MSEAVELLIRCPETNELVPTGIAAPPDDDTSLGTNTVGCPACGADHEWGPGGVFTPPVDD